MKVVDLFCGCGGLSLGFMNAGFDIVAAYDNWGYAYETYKENFDHPTFNIDLSIPDNYSHIEQHGADMIIGGPPCQDFSSAGKRDESMGRADLTVHFANIISLTKPRWFVMENVGRILKSKALIDARDIFKKEKYGLSQVVLNASLCGVPQNRKRFFLIGELNGTDNVLEKELIESQNNVPMTIHDFLGESLGTEHYYRHPRSYKRRGIFSIHEPSPTVRGVNRPIPPNYTFHSGDTCKDLSKVRPLTIEERSYLQTFPRGFTFLGSKTHKEQMVGNAVPVKLAEYLAEILLKYQKSDKTEYDFIGNGQMKLKL